MTTRKRGTTTTRQSTHNNAENRRIDFGLRVSASARKQAAAPITLLTDFGTFDYFVAAMKGVILGINPAAHLVDISHDIPPQDIHAAAFILVAAYRSFPPHTIHVAVVDPGVGSSRRAIVVAAANQVFIGPDNGIFSYVLERETSARSFHVENRRLFREPVSNTFHGRDIFAPVAAALSTGLDVNQVGPEIHDVVRLPILKAEELDSDSQRGRIIHIDRFGNCITSFTSTELTAKMIKNGARLKIKGKLITQFRQFFADGKAGEVFAVWGSAGFLEIVARNESAAKMLRARVGDVVQVSISGQ